MDLATIIGLALGFGAIIVCLILEGGKATELLNLPAFVLVAFGTVGATIIGFSMKQITALPKIVRNAFFSNNAEPSQVIDIMVDLARTARKDGILALEEQVRDLDNRFLKMGIQRVVDGTPSETVREILETEISSMQARHKVGEEIFATMGGFAPTLGIIGTVMGLINMLARLSEPGKMGHSIAAAFIATLYGVCFANLIFLPFAAKLKARTAEESTAYEMIIEGILSIQAGDNPRMVEAKMMAYLPPSLRESAGPEKVKREAA